MVSWHRRSYSAAPDTNTWWKIFGMRLRAYQAGEGGLARRVELDRLCEKTRRYACKLGSAMTGTCAGAVGAPRAVADRYHSSLGSARPGLPGVDGAP